MNIPQKPGIHFHEVENSKQHNALSIHNEYTKRTGSGWENQTCGKESENNFIKILFKWGGNG